MKTIAAVVVTYNRLADLQKCLARLRHQTRALDQIYVVDNGSIDGTGAWLSSEKNLVVVTQGNCGGAGGFATGMKTAFADGYDSLWCMDDDCLPALTALAQLENSPNIGPAIKNSMSISAKNDKELAFFVDRPNRQYRSVTDMSDQDLVYGVASLFNGTLISAEVIRTIGVPDARLFIWGDEVEYMTRAQKLGFPVVTVPKSQLYHPPSFDRDGIPWPGAWKQYYAVRNQRKVFQNIHGFKFGTLIYLSWSVRVTLAQLRAKRPNRGYNFLLFAEAGFDGAFNRFHKQPKNIRTLQLYTRLHRPKSLKASVVNPA